MRIFFLTVFIFASGCASSTMPRKGCSVIERIGGKSVPIGMIRLATNLENELRLQLPVERQNQYFCWDESGKQLIGTDRYSDNPFVFSYKFVKIGETWKLADEPFELLVVPHPLE